MKKTKIVALVLAVLMILSAVAGCGSTTSSVSSTTSASQSGSAEATGATGTVKLGGIGPLTGGAAIYGSAVKNAVELAVKEINAKGGLQFELDFQDDAHDAETSVNAYGNLMDWGMQILVGPVTSTPAAAVSPETAADNVFMLTPSASSPTVIEGRTNVYQMCFSDPNQGIASADYIADQKLGEKIAVIYNNGDAYSTGIYEKFASEAETKGLNIVYTGTFTDDSATDFSAQLTAAKTAGADLMFMPMYYTPISLIMTQAKAMNYDLTYFGVDGMDGLLTLDGFDATLAEGAYLLTPFSADAQDAATKAFVEAYNAAYGETPNQFAADGYDCVYAIYDALNAKGGDFTDMSCKDLCDILVGSFNGNLTFDGLTGAGMTWNEKGEVSKSPMAVIIKDGVYTSVD